MAFTFTGGLDLLKGGRRPVGRIKTLLNPDYTVIHLSKNRGSSFEPCVNEGDPVAVYQRVGTEICPEGEIPVYSGVSGRLREILKNDKGLFYGAVIDTDGEERTAPVTGYDGALSELTPERIIGILKEKAVPCRGPLRFAFNKIGVLQKKSERFLLNMCESEPGVASRKALCLTDPDAVLNGAKILMRAVDIRKCEIVIEKNDKELLKVITDKIKRDRLFSIVKVKDKYPQDEEAYVTASVCGVIPADLRRPDRSKVAVFDAETAEAAFRAVAYGIPYCRRIVTVDTENVLCPIGTPISELLFSCGVSMEDCRCIIAGGPMRGVACRSADEPVDAATDAVTVIYHGDGRHIPEMTECTSCGKCVSVCPSRIMPFYTAELSRKRKYAKCAEYGAAACTECGCCDYVCPAYVPIKKLIRTAKQRLPGDAGD